jgi:hypothetical protein
MTKLFGYLGAASFAALCSMAACTVSSTSDVSGVDAGTSDGSAARDSASTSDAASDAASDAGDGGSCTLAFSIGEAACDSCMGTNCCDAVNGCATNAECSALNSCYDACVSTDSGSADAGGELTACFDACDTAHPNGTATFDAINNCLQTNCSAQCQ